MRIPYAYLKQQTWLYRRSYPRALQPVLGQALKQSLKTGDAKLAKVRAAEVNAKYEEIVAKAGQGSLTPVAAVATALFGKTNTATQNNVDKLTGRFNMSLLLSKFVVSEEVKLQAGTRASNTLKTFITEPTVMAEMKGREAVSIEQKCCFLMTSNHLRHRSSLMNAVIGSRKLTTTDTPGVRDRRSSWYNNYLARIGKIYQRIALDKPKARLVNSFWLFMHAIVGLCSTDIDAMISHVIWDLGSCPTTRV